MRQAFIRCIPNKFYHLNSCLDTSTQPSIVLKAKYGCIHLNLQRLEIQWARQLCPGQCRSAPQPLSLLGNDPAIKLVQVWRDPYQKGKLTDGQRNLNLLSLPHPPHLPIPLLRYSVYLFSTNVPAAGRKIGLGFKWSWFSSCCLLPRRLPVLELGRWNMIKLFSGDFF